MTIDQSDGSSSDSPEGFADLSASILCGQVEERVVLDKAVIHGDSVLYNKMAASGFRGDLYDRFKTESSRYGVGVLRAWISTGYIFSLTETYGWSLHPSHVERAELQEDQDAALSLAGITVAVAFKKFHSRALVGGKWRPDRGASLKTYFMGTVVGVFPNEFRKYRKEANRTREPQISLDAIDVRDLDAMSSRDMEDPHEASLAKLAVQNYLAKISDPRLRAMVALKADGWTLDEIADVLGSDRIRSIEGCLYRWRTRARQGTEKGGGLDAF